MVSLADVARRHGPAYLARHRGAMLPSHVRALSAITHCRTPSLGAHLGVCAQCARRHLLYHSCRHRACPRCGSEETERWLARQGELLLPTPYFHVVFTVPSELRPLFRSHQKALYGALFRTAFEALRQLCAEEKHLGGEIGALAVLHSWTRALVYHPHVHMLVAGGALGSDGSWRSARRRGRKLYLVPAAALGELFAGKLLHALGQALPDETVPTIAEGTRWVVDIKRVEQGADAVLRYLGRYVHRTAIGPSAIVDCDDDTVTFRYRDGQSGQRRTMRLDAHEFLRRYLQHVLPKGLHRVRSYGLLHPNRRDTLRQLQLLLDRGSDPEPARPRRERRLRCPHCRDGTLVLVRNLSAQECLAQLEALAATARGPPPHAELGAVPP